MLEVARPFDPNRVAVAGGQEGPERDAARAAALVADARARIADDGVAAGAQRHREVHVDVVGRMERLVEAAHRRVALAADHQARTGAVVGRVDVAEGRRGPAPHRSTAGRVVPSRQSTWPAVCTCAPSRSRTRLPTAPASGCRSNARASAASHPGITSVSSWRTCSSRPRAWRIPRFAPPASPSGMSERTMRAPSTDRRALLHARLGRVEHDHHLVRRRIRRPPRRSPPGSAAGARARARSR